MSVLHIVCLISVLNVNVKVIVRTSRCLLHDCTTSPINRLQLYLVTSLFLYPSSDSNICSSRVKLTFLGIRDLSMRVPLIQSVPAKTFQIMFDFFVHNGILAQLTYKCGVCVILFVQLHRKTVGQQGVYLGRNFVTPVRVHSSSSSSSSPRHSSR